jgi:DNA polymerase-3 subunit alpha
VRWPTSDPSSSSRFEQIIKPWRGGPCAITVEYRNTGAMGALALGAEWNVKPTRELIEQLESFAGDKGLRVIYGAPSQRPAVASG